MKKIEYRVEESDELMEFLRKKLVGVSRTKLKEIMAHEVYVDGRKVSQFNFPLHAGMIVSLEKRGYYERFTPRGLDIVYEDEYLLVVNKKEGLLSYSKNVKDETVISVLNKYFVYTHKKCHAHIVHRLDRDTSGLMIVSKTKEVSRQFEEDWKGMVYDRKYVAVAWGNVEEDSGVIRSWLTDGKYCVLSSNEDNGGKEAITNYRVISRSRRYTMLDLKLDTGRRNQIRVHLREMKHPVVHDPMYGYKEDVSPINRLALHAYKLCFVHPILKKKLEFETKIPESFMRLMEL